MLNIEEIQSCIEENLRQNKVWGSEEVEIALKYHTFVDEEMIDYFRGVIADYFDGAHVTHMRWESIR